MTTKAELLQQTRNELKAERDAALREVELLKTVLQEAERLLGYKFPDVWESRFRDLSWAVAEYHKERRRDQG